MGVVLVLDVPRGRPCFRLSQEVALAEAAAVAALTNFVVVQHKPERSVLHDLTQALAKLGSGRRRHVTAASATPTILSHVHVVSADPKALHDFATAVRGAEDTDTRRVLGDVDCFSVSGCGGFPNTMSALDLLQSGTRNVVGWRTATNPLGSLLWTIEFFCGLCDLAQAADVPAASVPTLCERTNKTIDDRFGGPTGAVGGLRMRSGGDGQTRTSTDAHGLTLVVRRIGTPCVLVGETRVPVVSSGGTTTTPTLPPHPVPLPSLPLSACLVPRRDVEQQLEALVGANVTRTKEDDDGRPSAVIVCAPTDSGKEEVADASFNLHRAVGLRSAVLRVAREQAASAVVLNGGAKRRWTRVVWLECGHGRSTLQVLRRLAQQVGVDEALDDCDLGAPLTAVVKAMRRAFLDYAANSDARVLVVAADVRRPDLAECICSIVQRPSIAVLTTSTPAVAVFPGPKVYVCT